jgi:hypothetical protein
VPRGLTATFPSPLIDLADHNISPSLDKQLVLELEIRVRELEIFNALPRCFGHRQTSSLNQDMPHTAPKAGTQHAFWVEQDTVVTKRWQGRS